MLTPAQVRDYEFKGAGRNAYKAEEVDEFLATVAIDYEKMFRENAELIKRVGLLADRLDQMKKEEADIKLAVISAQKAADLIVKDAEDSVADAHTEAEEILAAAKGEAQIIKSDAEKQAVADSDMLLSVAREKAGKIIEKAKNEAMSIIIDAKDSAKDKVGAANRTVTSESLYYDMLKKEVSDFRANILAQYKTHIELISKLPEIAAEEAKNIPEKSVVKDVILDVDSNNNLKEDSVLEFVSDSEEETVTDIQLEEAETEDVVKTTLPFDFFAEDTNLEFVQEDTESGDEPVRAGGFSVDVSAVDFSDDEEEEEDAEETEDTLSFIDEDVSDDSEAEAEDDFSSHDIPISGGFKVDMADFSSDDFSDLEEDSEDEEYGEDENVEDEADSEENYESDEDDESDFEDEDAEESADDEDADFEDDNIDVDDGDSEKKLSLESFEKIDSDIDDGSNDGKRRFGFFRRKK